MAEQVAEFDANLTAALARYNVADATIAEWRAQYLPLAITDIDDKEQLRTVHDARMVVKGARVEVEKTRKELKEDALRWGRAVDAEAKRITSLLAPIEEHLEREEDRALEERQRRKEEALQARMALLTEAHSPLVPAVVERMNDEQFEAALAEAREAWAAEVERKKAEAAALEAERAALEKQRAELAAREAEAERKRQAEEAALQAERDRIREEQEAERARIRAEQEAAQAEARRKLAEEQERQAAERERIAAERRALDERLEAEARAAAEREAFERDQAEAAERARIAAERAPEADRVLAYADALDALPTPDVWCTDSLLEIVSRATAEIRELVRDGGAA